jgi:hypothetical protein
VAFGGSGHVSRGKCWRAGLRLCGDVRANPQKLDLLPTVEWNGPDSIFFKRTQIDFLYGKLLSYTTENRGAL